MMLEDTKATHQAEAVEKRAFEVEKNASEAKRKALKVMVKALEVEKDQAKAVTKLDHLKVVKGNEYRISSEKRKRWLAKKFVDAKKIRATEGACLAIEALGLLKSFPIRRLTTMRIPSSLVRGMPQEGHQPLP